MEACGWLLAFALVPGPSPCERPFSASDGRALRLRGGARCPLRGTRARRRPRRAEPRWDGDPSWTSTRSEHGGEAGDAEAAMLRWLRDGGADFPLRVMPDPQTGVRGAYAAADVAAGSRIAVIPACRVAAYEAIARSEELGFRCRGLSRFDGDEALAVFLLLERAKGPESAWAPYLAALPDLSSFPAFWTPSEIDRLQGSPARELVLGQRFAYRYAFERLAPPLLRHPACPAPLRRPGALTPETFAWAMAVQQTRATRRQGDVRWDRSDKALVAGMDLLNHSCEPGGANAAVAWLSPGSDASSLEPGRPLVEIRATRDLRAGDEALLSYGDLPNFQLLAGFGFAVPGNGHDGTVLAAAGAGGGPLAPARLEALRGLGFAPRGGDRFELLLWARKALPHELVSYLQIATAESAEELSRLARALAERRPDRPLPPGGPEAEAAALPPAARRLLCDLLEARLREYPPPGDPPPGDERAALAAAVVEGEAALLKGWLRAARAAERRSPLDAALDGR